MAVFQAPRGLTAKDAPVYRALRAAPEQRQGWQGGERRFRVQDSGFKVYKTEHGTLANIQLSLLLREYSNQKSQTISKYP